MLSVDKLTQLFKQMNRFDELVGLELALDDTQTPFYALTIQEKHESSPQTAHGAVLAGMMDAQLGILALARAIEQQSFCSTVELKTNFFHPARVGDRLLGSGEIDFVGKSLIVVSAEIRVEKTRKLIAKGMGTFNLYPMSKRQNILEDFGKDIQ